MKNGMKTVSVLRALRPFTQMGFLSGEDASVIADFSGNGDDSFLRAFVEQKNDLPDWAEGEFEKIREKFLR